MLRKYHGGGIHHLLVWFALTSKILVFSSPLPTIHQDLVDGEDSDLDDGLVQQPSSAESSLGLASSSSFFAGAVPSPDAQPALPEAARQNTKESKEYRNKFRRIKSPVRRRNRVMLLLKSEMGKVQIAIEDVKDECHRKKLAQDVCDNSKMALELQGKLRRIQSAFISVQELGKEAEQIQDMEVQAQKDLQNATQYHHKAKTMLSGRMIAIEDVEKRIKELQKEDLKNSVMQSRWEEALNENWERMRKANEAQRAVEGFNIKFSAKLKGILKGMELADGNAAEDFDNAEAIDKKAELVEARARLLEEKAKHILEEQEQRKGEERFSAGSKVEYQKNEDGILASDSSSPLDSFGEARAHPKFGNQNFMAQRQPLLVGKQEELNNMGDKLESRHEAMTERSLNAMFSKDSDHLNSDVTGTNDMNVAEDSDVVD